MGAAALVGAGRRPSRCRSDQRGPAPLDRDRKRRLAPPGPGRSALPRAARRSGVVARLVDRRRGPLARGGTRRGADRESVGEGKKGAVRVVLGECRMFKAKNIMK